MKVLDARLVDFRSYRDATIALGDGLTVMTGANGAGKTNVLEAIYLGCTGRSCRTHNDREVVRFGAPAARVNVRAVAEDGCHDLAVAVAPGQPKRMKLDGASVERLLDVEIRPLVGVFLPDRLELIKGPPALRRAHVDQLVAALWPSRGLTRRAYAQTLAQRNALLGRVRAGTASRTSLESWDAQLAARGIALMEDRKQATEVLAPGFLEVCEKLGLDGDPSVSFRPRSRAHDADALARELAERTGLDLERGFTSHGPHRDELSITREGRELRTYGSQGQQRLALLALLLAERLVIAAARGAAPLMLLDDVMSELDARRREALVQWLQDADGQSVITATELDQVPQGEGGAQVVISNGMIASGALVS